ncbi:bacterial transcriptional activator domain-containing protein [Fodinicola feengrottensis]|nr:bacterial transcriptional activator domain-containing protein [Fodinicola feengrottensis]
MDVLWPDESSSRVANRLSVALSAVRTVLDPDRVHPADFFVAADRYAVTLSNLAVDAEIFVFHATVALERHYCGDRDAAHALAFAESLYVGDFLPADQCVEWTAPVRETAKANYLEVVRALAKLSADSGQHHLAVLPPAGVAAGRLRRGRASGAGAGLPDHRTDQCGAPALPQLRGQDGGDRGGPGAAAGRGPVADKTGRLSFLGL